ncbi:helix-turn-helix transcriptional regulator [Amycolatopsis sp. NPDC051373]|uniref:helix-turn-helix domain-containing protein n=1 Tax=Amycolatopsis sp. NPDC051373 TaxID=3155801 RepID=UPI00344E871E
MPSMRETPRQVELGALLRALRKRSGLDQKTVSTDLGRNQTHISRWENGRLLIEQPELERFLALCEATSEETAAALRLHRDAADPNWLQLSGGNKDLALVSEYERAAGAVTSIQPALIPGPLQIAAYARDMMLAGGETEDQVKAATARRMARRDSILNGSTPYEALIGELAIRYPACSREVAVDQLRDLCQVAERPHITIRVVPFRFGYDPSREGGFVLIRSEGRSVVHLEELSTATTLSRAKEVERYVTAANRIRDIAIGAVASTKLIAQIADELERS